MMTDEFIDWCLARDVSLSLDGENLKINAPPGALTESVVAELEQRKADIIEWLGQRELHTIRPRPNPEEPTPLSYSQKRLWVTDQLEAGTTHYNMLGGFEITGQCDPDIVERVFGTIVERHEVLRTRFELVAEQPVQCVQADVPFYLLRHDIAHLPLEKQTQFVKSLLDAEADYCFDLAGELLIRAHFVQISQSQFSLLVNMHHIVSDGWSLGVICEEFVSLFSAFTQAQQNPLPPLAIQYADYAAWQVRYLSGETLQKQLAFWQQQLAGIPQLHSLPLDSPRPKQQSFVAEGVNITITPQKHQKLLQLANRHNVTLFMLLQTAFAALLSRVSGEQDIVMGVPSAGRSRAELESLIGFFINTLLFRTQCRGDLTFAQLLEQNKQYTMDAFAHQDMPFELLVDELQADRNLAYNSLCQVKFMLRTENTDGHDIPGLTISPMVNTEQSVRFDLDLSITESDAGLNCLWCYKSELFKRESIRQLAEQFDQIIEAILDDMSVSLLALPLLTKEQSLVLADLGCAPKVTYPESDNVVSVFERQADSVPNNVAVRDNDTELTYAQLNDKANRLADYLLEAGVEPGECVALFMHSNIGLLIAMLAVLKIRACYIPIEPSNTKKRVEFILSDADVEMIISEADYLPLLPIQGSNVLTLYGWQSDDWYRAYNAKNPGEAIAPQDSAYVIYTSGSTGQPKGVDIPHSALSDYCFSALQAYFPSDMYGSLVVTSHAFDITVPALYLPLMRGVCVTLLPKSSRLESLAQQIQKSDRQLIRMTPMHGKGLLALLSEACPEKAHTFVVGGETFPVALAKQLQAHFPKSQIFNHYGPTEATVGCTLFDVTANIERLGDRVPLGRPFLNHH